LTLLDGHPRIKELKAQLADLDRQLREEANEILHSLDNDARIAAGRIEDLNTSLEQLRKQLTSTNGQDVQLRALEREARTQRDLLETYLAKYREASIPENIDTAPPRGRIISAATASSTPVYPNKLPIVLIATLATLMLSAGAVGSGELLGMRAPPRAVGAFASSPASAPVQPSPVPAVAATVAADSAPAAVTGEPPIKVAPGLTEIEQLAENLRGAGDATRKVTILGTAAGERITLTALTLARLIARHAKVVVVDLSASSPMISAVSLDPSAPGLAELMLGQASFSQVITKDRLSRAHLVSAGRPGSDRALLQSPRLMLAIDALLRVYDYVLLEAGSASDLSADLLTARARAVVVPDASMADDARTVMCDQLKAVGFTEVMLLSKPSEPLSAIEPGPRVAAA
jgi:Mrp family chromosome partitioning ATPase